MEEQGGTPRFVHVQMDPEDVTAVARKVERKVCRLLARRGLLPGDEADEQVAEDASDPDRQGQLALLAASATLRAATGHPQRRGEGGCALSGFRPRHPRAVRPPRPV